MSSPLEHPRISRLYALVRMRESGMKSPLVRGVYDHDRSPRDALLPPSVAAEHSHESTPWQRFTVPLATHECGGIPRVARVLDTHARAIEAWYLIALARSLPIQGASMGAMNRLIPS